MALQEKKYYDQLRNSLPPRYANAVAKKAGNGITKQKVLNVFNLRTKDELLIMQVVVAARKVAKEYQGLKKKLKQQLADLN